MDQLKELNSALFVKKQWETPKISLLESGIVKGLNKVGNDGGGESTAS